MAYVPRLFDCMEELADYLNGLVGGKYLGQRTFGLDGLTLIINDGGADRTVTFADPTFEGLLAKQILDQIRATHAALETVALRNYGHQAPPQQKLMVVTVGHKVLKTGTANALLGFSTAVDVVVGAAAVAQADIVSILWGTNSNKISLLHV